MPKILKKSIASLLITVLLFSSFVRFFPTPAKAQGLSEIFGTGPWYRQSLSQFFTKVNDPDNADEVFGERYTYAQVDWIIWSVLMWLPSRITGTEFWYCIFTTDVAGCWASIKQGNAPQNEFLALTKNNSPPQEKRKLHEVVFEERGFSGITYVKNILRNASLIPQVNAQGFGYSQAIIPIQSMWQGARDIAYIFFVLITIIMAFMIMFRVKIAPQVVITVQSALPKIAVAIILVTFSYAIAGLLIDLMYVVFGFISLLATRMFGKYDSVFIFNFITGGQLDTIVGDFQVGVIGLSLIYIWIFNATAVAIFFVGFMEIFTKVLGVALVTPLGVGVGVIGIFLLIIFFIALLVLVMLSLINALKIIWILFRTYVAILLLTIFAPFQIVIGILVPSWGIGAWLKSYISKLAIFVTTGLMFLLSFYFLSQGMILAFKGSFGEELAESVVETIFGEIPNEIELGNNVGWPPLLRHGSVNETEKPFGTAFIFLMVSLVIFTLIPRIEGIIKSLLDKRPFAYGTAIGQAVGAAATPVSYPIQKGFGAASEGIQKGASRRLADTIQKQDVSNK